MVSLLFPSLQKRYFSFKLLYFFFKSFDDNSRISSFISFCNVFNQSNPSGKLTCWKRLLNMFRICVHSSNKSCFTISTNWVTKHHCHHRVSVRNVDWLSFLCSLVKSNNNLNQIMKRDIDEFCFEKLFSIDSRFSSSFRTWKINKLDFWTNFRIRAVLVWF